MKGDLERDSPGGDTYDIDEKLLPPGEHLFQTFHPDLTTLPFFTLQPAR